MPPKKKRKPIRPPTLAVIPAGSNPRNDREAIALELLFGKTCADPEFRDDGHYIDIDSRELGCHLGTKDYAGTLAGLEADGQIEIDDSYSVGRTRRKTKIDGVALEGHGFPKSYRLVERLRKPEYREHALKRQPKQECLRLNFTSASDKELVQHFGRFKINPAPDAEGWERVAGMIASRWRKFYAQRLCKDRFYSNFTNLPKRLRSAMTVDGEPVTEIDISNSQPLLLVNLLREWVQGPEPPEDVALYASVCQAGRFYDFLLSECRHLSKRDLHPTRRMEIGESETPCRDDVKLAAMVVMFGKVEDMKRNALWGIVLDKFPTLSGFLEEAKTPCHTVLSAKLRRLESRVMIDGAAKAISRLEIPIVTIHDSIMVPLQHADTARREILLAWGRINLTPHVK